jgi:hypothetical protein
MNVQRGDFLLLVTLAAWAAPALGQDIASAIVQANSNMPTAASIPDFSGIWARLSFPGFEPPLSGPGPVTNRSRRNGASNYDQLVGDYTNPILHPWAAEVVKKFGEMSLAGITFPNPRNQCWPGGVPYVFSNLVAATYLHGTFISPSQVCYRYADPKGEGARANLTVYTQSARIAADAADARARAGITLGTLDGAIVSSWIARI